MHFIYQSQESTIPVSQIVRIIFSNTKIISIPKDLSKKMRNYR